MSPDGDDLEQARPTRVHDDMSWTMAGISCVAGLFLGSLALVLGFMASAATSATWGLIAGALFFGGRGIVQAVPIWRRRRANDYPLAALDGGRASERERAAGQSRLEMAPWFAGVGLVLAGMAAYFLLQASHGGPAAGGNRLAAALMGVVAVYGLGLYQLVTGRLMSRRGAGGHGPRQRR